MKRVWMLLAVSTAVVTSLAELLRHRTAISAALLEGIEYAFNAMDSLLHPAA